MLSPEQIESFRRDGFLVLEEFVESDACAALRARAIEIVDDWQPSETRTAFTTIEDESPRNAEFLASGGIVWCFFEEEAFGPDGQLRQPKELSINKIGHAMHDLDPVFERFTYTSRLAEVAADIGLVDALALQSMYIFKQPSIGGEVTCHQDATFLYTEPISVTGFWFAIEDATLENGCLWAAPGGHRTGLRQLFKRTGAMTDEDGTVIETLDPTPLPTPPDDLVPLEVPAGTMVVLDGQLPHWSGANRSAHSRHAYTVHCISAAADYPAWNWLQRPADMPLRRLATVAA
ncbi:MAG: phytanoyl-CoA dioxygenase family protein [Ilumatobacter sp.]|uniref:phytanoyl-CoA dioxygenase family protein n=1 Tax=Ilumatobacter sp. TaxID=1967498 RepID=UPI0026265463|nr:phytanoyl-CoA dioxygenase family protein [Ilumatobacter sp.]MDJ0767726.1 phytanoyl-CoA dioxygenase family protein [Ilumatobacter sp.]